MSSSKTIPMPDIKQHLYQLIEQLPSEQLPKILRLMETRYHDTNTGVESDSVTKFTQSQLTKHPSLKFAGVFKDDPNWEEFQTAIASYRREVDAQEGGYESTRY
jgi:hypothetical protein